MGIGISEMGILNSKKYNNKEGAFDAPFLFLLMQQVLRY